jgi:hypothetical protein
MHRHMFRGQGNTYAATVRLISIFPQAIELVVSYTPSFTICSLRSSIILAAFWKIVLLSIGDVALQPDREKNLPKPIQRTELLTWKSGMSGINSSTNIILSGSCYIEQMLARVRVVSSVCFRARMLLTINDARYLSRRKWIR